MDAIVFNADCAIWYASVVGDGCTKFILISLCANPLGHPRSDIAMTCPASKETSQDEYNPLNRLMN